MRDENGSITEKVLKYWDNDEDDIPTTTKHLADVIMAAVSPEIMTDYSVLQNPFSQADLVCIALIYCRTMFSRGLFLSIDKLKESEASSIEDRIFGEIEDIYISTALQSLYGIDVDKWKAAHERRRKERKLIDLVKEPKSIQPFIEHAVSTFIFPDYLNNCFLAYPLEHPYTLAAQDQVERQVLKIFNLFLERVHWNLGELLGEATSRYDYEHRQPTPKQTNMAEVRESLAQLRKKAELESAQKRVRWDKAIAQKQVSPDMRPTITLVNRGLVVRFDWDSRSLSQGQLRDQMRRGSEYYFWDVRRQTVGKLLVTHTYWDSFTYSYLQKNYYCSFMKASRTLYESYDDVLTREQRIEKEKRQREMIILGEAEKITSSSE